MEGNGLFTYIVFMFQSKLHALSEAFHSLGDSLLKIFVFDLKCQQS
jgi:hypothetical protein